MTTYMLTIYISCLVISLWCNHMWPVPIICDHETSHIQHKLTNLSYSHHMLPKVTKMMDLARTQQNWENHIWTLRSRKRMVECVVIPNVTVLLLFHLLLHSNHSPKSCS